MPYLITELRNPFRCRGLKPSTCEEKVYMYKIMEYTKSRPQPSPPTQGLVNTHRFPENITNQHNLVLTIHVQLCIRSNIFKEITPGKMGMHSVQQASSRRHKEYTTSRYLQCGTEKPLMLPHSCILVTTQGFMKIRVVVVRTNQHGNHVRLK